jgi:alpha-D-ribose 1-methylphosphonate 5-triphosphate synthase subunit PhnG
MHPRRRAVRVVMMAVVAMGQHDNIARLWHAGEPVNGRDHIRAPDFSIVAIQILHGSWLTPS